MENLIKSNSIQSFAAPRQASYVVGANNVATMDNYTLTTTAGNTLAQPSVTWTADSLLASGSA